ncbi:MAG: Branched-chain-amino-acid aminotransferase [Planctomycetes bacterium]|nr:Branched-chain-amino-acid aminotransferase [Planctomycetota bacterium]
MTAIPGLPEGVVSVDGVIRPVAEARVHAMDHGFLFGDSIYEVVRTLGRRPVAMAEHLVRLRASAEALYMALPWTDREISRAMGDAVAATDFPECYVRIVVTRGAGAMSLLPDVCPRPSMIVYALPLRTPTAEDLARGAQVAVPARLRNDRRALAPAAKTGNYLNNVLALVEARRAGGEDAILLNAQGHVTEATTANVFWAKGGRLATPSLDCGILAGITRTLLIDALRSEGAPVDEGRFGYEDMCGADEVMLTGTVRGVSPVVRIDGRTIGDGRPGPVTRSLIARYDGLLAAATQDW